MQKNKKLNTIPAFQPPSLTTLIIFTISLSCLALLGGFKLAALNQPYRNYVPPIVIAQRTYTPASIDMASVDIHLPVQESQIVNGQWQVSTIGASHLVSSGKPGQNNNIVIYGHNLNNLFGRIRNLHTGDTITVKTADGKLHMYKVTETLTVNPDHVEVVYPTKSEVLTLFTCDGFADSIRFVVRAKPIHTEVKSTFN